MKNQIVRRQRVIPDQENEFYNLIEFLRLSQTLRRYCIKVQSRSDRMLEHLIAQPLGYNTGLLEPERKRLMNLAKSIRIKVERDIRNRTDPELVPEIPEEIFAMVRVSFASRQHWDQKREQIESQMEQAARLLPVWPWVKSISGIAELGLAVLVGEAGDIGNYSGPGKLWMRFGLGCFDGYRQGYIPKEITGDERKEAWKLRGYNPVRRAEVWSFLDDSMFRAQWRGARDEDGKNPFTTKKPVVVEAHGIGPYGQIYGDRKAWNVARGLPPLHADREAKRFMAQKFVRDLWIAWQDAKIRQAPQAEVLETV